MAQMTQHDIEESMRMFSLTQHIITTIRQLRASNQIPPGKKIPVYLVVNSWSMLFNMVTLKALETIEKLASAEFVDAWFDVKEPEHSITTTINSDSDQKVTICLDVGSLIDIEAEILRLEKKVAVLEPKLKKATAKLFDKNFLDKAPEDVIQKTSDLVDQFTSELSDAEFDIGRYKAKRVEGAD